MKPLDLSRAKTVALSNRDSAYGVDRFIKTDTVPDVTQLEAAWPRILKGNELSQFLDLWSKAAGSRTCVFMFGAHVIKCGLAPLLCQLAEAGAVSVFSTHGAGALHDVEVALNGATSEDVDAKPNSTSKPSAVLQKRGWAWVRRWL
jgi:hypothetical protein